MSVHIIVLCMLSRVALARPGSTAATISSTSKSPTPCTCTSALALKAWARTKPVTSSTTNSASPAAPLALPPPAAGCATRAARAAIVPPHGAAAAPPARRCRGHRSWPAVAVHPPRSSPWPWRRRALARLPDTTQRNLEPLAGAPTEESRAHGDERQQQQQGGRAERGMGRGGLLKDSKAE
eukprot:scaffold415_cov362-Prasinococcus_capsulatus_cf.AAC.12